MTFVMVMPAIVCFLLMGAHWLRNGSLVLVGLSLAVGFVLLVCKPWAARLIQLTLLLAGLEWVRTTWSIAQVRMEDGIPWTRAAVILLCVAATNFVAAGLFQTSRLKRRYGMLRP